MAAKKVLVIGYGNPGRLDDGLGPALAGAIEEKAIPGTTVDADYQLSIECAAEAARHEFVIFADADASGTEPYYFRPVEPDASGSFTTHHVSPGAVLSLARSCFGAETSGYVLGIRGYDFDGFGEGLSSKARENLESAVAFLDTIIREGRIREAADKTLSKNEQ